MKRRDQERVRLVRVRGKDSIGTLNLVPGHSVYGENFFHINEGEYRIWDPTRSKLAAAILNGLRDLPIKENSRILYLGASTGTTVSHISDIIGENGILFAVEVSPRVAREFLERVALNRTNIIPIISDARRPDTYHSIFSSIDIIYCDIAQPDQTEIALYNCRKYLVKGGILLLVVKSRSIDTIADPKKIFKTEVSKLENAKLRIKQIIPLEPFDIDHVLIYAIS